MWILKIDSWRVVFNTQNYEDLSFVISCFGNIETLLYIVYYSYVFYVFYSSVYYSYVLVLFSLYYFNYDYSSRSVISVKV